MFIVSDFDGTLAEFSTDPMNVPINEEAMRALDELATIPGVRVAILSGRSLEHLTQLVDVRDEVILAGSHGAETLGQPTGPTQEQSRQLATLDAALDELLHGGAWVEVKPFGRVLHTRKITSGAEELQQRARDIEFGGRIQEGKAVVEFSVSDATKGEWITANRRPGEHVIFLGDDVTDETGFAVLGEGDTGVKVGPGETLATVRLADVTAVGNYLTKLARSLRSGRE